MLFTPLQSRQFDGPPRIISEIRKNCISHNCLIDFKPRLTGDLLVRTSGDKIWWPRKADIRAGHLHLLGCYGEDAPTAFRLPLRHLSLQAGLLPYSLSLCQGNNIVLTIQAPTKQSFEIWVKTIAIELIRQTPLEDVKYLDIFTLASYWDQKGSMKDCNSNYVEVQNENFVSSKSKEPSNEQTTIEYLFKKCQNVENYVPVREKLVLFESLCKFGRKVRSTENVSLNTIERTKRTLSLHDLSHANGHSAVREICKYFEVKSDAINNITKYGTITRLNKSDSTLHSVQKTC